MLANRSQTNTDAALRFKPFFHGAVAAGTDPEGGNTNRSSLFQLQTTHLTRGTTQEKCFCETASSQVNLPRESHMFLTSPAQLCAQYASPPGRNASTGGRRSLKRRMTGDGSVPVTAPQDPNWHHSFGFSRLMLTKYKGEQCGADHLLMCSLCGGAV